MARALEWHANDQAVKNGLVASVRPSPLAPYLCTLKEGIALDELIMENSMMTKGKEIFLAILDFFFWMALYDCNDLEDIMESSIYTVYREKRLFWYRSEDWCIND